MVSFEEADTNILMNSLDFWPHRLPAPFMLIQWLEARPSGKRMVEIQRWLMEKVVLFYFVPKAWGLHSADPVSYLFCIQPSTSSQVSSGKQYAHLLPCFPSLYHCWQKLMTEPEPVRCKLESGWDFWKRVCFPAKKGLGHNVGKAITERETKRKTKPRL